MNYRHAFHAGNFADVTKHALVARILVHLARKPAPFRFVDTHAGVGLYDLAGPEAERGREWEGGVGRIEAPFAPPVEALLAPYRAALAEVRRRHGPYAYPGSPALAREMLRPADRAILIEKHPEDGAALAARFNTVGTLKVLRGDGWALLGGLLPPRERRGFVLVDPPYEEPGELAAAVPRLAAALRRWPSGIVALWYPIKSRREVADLAGRLTSAVVAPALRLELMAEEPRGGGKLAGSGLAVVNPPWTLAGEAEILLPALAERMRGGPGGGARVETLVPG